MHHITLFLTWDGWNLTGLWSAVKKLEIKWTDFVAVGRHERWEAPHTALIWKKKKKRKVSQRKEGRRQRAMNTKPERPGSLSYEWHFLLLTLFPASVSLSVIMKVRSGLTYIMAGALAWANDMRHLNFLLKADVRQFVQWLVCCSLGSFSYMCSAESLQLSLNMWHCKIQTIYSVRRMSVNCHHY